MQNRLVERLVPEPEARVANGRQGGAWQLRIPAPKARERLSSLVFTQRSGVKIQCSDLLYSQIIGTKR